MKIIVRAALAAVSIAALSACTINTGAEPASDTSDTSDTSIDMPEVETSDVSPETAREVLYGQSSFWRNVGDAQTDDTAHAACDALDGGVDVGALVMAGSGDVDAGDVGSLIAYAVYAFCPQHQDAVDAWATS